MKDIKDFIKVADLYAQDSLTENKKIEEGLGDWLMDKLGFGKPEAEAVVDAAKAEAETLDIDPEVVDTTEIVGSASTDTTGTTDTTATTGNKTAKEVWDEIKAKRDPLPQGPERVRLSNLMNQINVTSTTPEEAAKILAQAANRPSDAELDANTDAATDTTTNTTFDSINDAQNADNLKAGDIITIDGKEAEVGETDDGQQFFVHPGSDISIDKPKPPAPQGELSATDTAQTATKTVAPGTGADGPAGGAKAPAETPPAATATDNTTSAGPDDGTRGNQSVTNPDGSASTGTDAPQPRAAPSNGSLLGRKLDTTTPNIMKAYNDGGKQAMPTIRNMQTALSRLGFDPNGIDGKYGNGTFKAVQAFQKANGLAVDGQAGPDTMKSMKAILDKNFEKNKVTPADTAKAAANNPAPTTQYASKDHIT